MSACHTCGEPAGLEKVTSRALADRSERTERFCADAAACNDRRFPGLAVMLGTAPEGTGDAK